MSSSEFELDDSDRDDNENHDQLVLAAKSLDGGLRIQKHQRSELALVDSKYHLTKTKYDNDERNLTKSKKKEKKAKQESAPDLEQTVLSKPLEKPVAEKIQRQVGYEATKKELNKWNSIVANNRTAACISFPLTQSSIKFKPTNEFVQRYRIKSELQQKLESLKEKEKSEDEDDEFQMTMEEAIQKQKETAKLKAQENYRAAKAHRQNKIKSKKFHRIQRKEKIKKAIVEFEKLRETDPEAALKKLQELDNARIKERMTLRHKNTGKWAQSQKIRAKYDKDTRQELAEQLAVSRDLTQKVKQDDSDEDMDDLPPIPVSSSDKENPWMYPVKPDAEVADFINTYKKQQQEIKNKMTHSEKQSGQSESSDKNNRVNHIFPVPEISESTKNSDSVEKVTQTNSSDQNGVNVSDELKDVKQTSVNQKKKKIQKTLKDKLNFEATNNKVVNNDKIKAKSGTSSWLIESVSSEVSISNKKNKEKLKRKSAVIAAIENASKKDGNLDIDDMFDIMNDKIQESLSVKLAKKKRKFEKEEKYVEKRLAKKKQKKESVDELEKLGLKGQKIIRPSLEQPLQESANSKLPEENSELENITNITDFNRKVTSQSNKAEIDPNKYINIKPKHVKTVMPDEAGEVQDAMDDESEQEEDQQKIISEAFADDDVVDEFKQEKLNEIKNSQPTDIDLTLPGWGSWGGKNLKIPKHKKRRFIVKVPKAETRRDENKGNVVIIEEKNPKIKKHLVSELPFPFTSVQDYEASIRAPLSREFVPEKVFSKLTTPALKTKMGKVIEPMSEDALVNIKSDFNKKKKLTKSEINKLRKTDDGNKTGKNNKSGKPNTRKNVKKSQNGVKA